MRQRDSRQRKPPASTVAASADGLGYEWIDYQKGELFGGHVEYRPLDEEEWKADDWEVFDLSSLGE